MTVMADPITLCTCKFRASGVSMDNTDCVVHTKDHYECDRCDCTDYRPHKAPLAPIADTHKSMRLGVGGLRWASCVCGHSAQDHN